MKKNNKEYLHCRGIIVFLMLLFVGLSSEIIYAQKGYIATDTSYNGGITIFPGKPSDNARICRARFRGQNMEFTPQDITEYGLEGANPYFSKEIDVMGKHERLFLERLVDDTTQIYYLAYNKHKFFLVGEDSGSLVVMDKRGRNAMEFREALRNYTSDNPSIAAEAAYIEFNKGSVARFIEMYNSGMCHSFSTVRYGILGVMGNMKLSTPSSGILANSGKITFDPDKYFGAGVFAEFPIAGSDFAFRPEIQISHNSFSWDDMKIVDENLSYDIVMNLTGLKIPLLVGYTFHSIKPRPFIHAGPSLYYAIQNESTTYIFKGYDQTIECTGVITDELVGSMQPGLECGMGMQIPLKKHKSIDLELRYVKLWTKRSLWEISTIQFITGFNLL